MAIKFKKINILVCLGVVASLVMSVISCVGVSAKTGVAFTVSPMIEKIVLNPGDKYSSSLNISIPVDYENDMKYSLKVAPYFVNEDYENDFTNEHGSSNSIVKWITLDSPESGRLSPGEKKDIVYTINVPRDASGGGQYASIMVTVDVWNDDSDKDDDIESHTNSSDTYSSITEIKTIAYTIYAEITGNVIRQGEIEELNVAGFLLSGDITGTSSVKNTGNVHGEAKYKLQVFPMFSDEEIYTNEENPAGRTILPDRTLYNETTWPDTPTFGIFNVVYTVEFEGVTAQVKKMVIKCPVWMLFIVIFVIFALIIWLFLSFKKRREARR